MKSLYAHDVIDVLPLSVFWRFGTKLVPKARYGTLLSFLTYGYHKLQLVQLEAKLLRYVFAKHEIAY